MAESTLEPWQWGALVILFVVVLTVISDVLVRLWRAPPAPEPCAPVYDWKQDHGLLDVWARDEEGEVLTVIPANWLYK
jgi:hypothetical protein